MIERPSGIRACVFDAYGTLFDVRNVAVGVIERTGVDSKAFFDIWRAKQLEYSWLRAVTGHHVDFWQVTRDALDYALESFGIAGSALGSAMMDAYLRLPIFPDVLPTLEQLRASGLRRAILSNGTAHMLSAIVAHAGVTEHFEALLSVEEVGIFKPHRECMHWRRSGCRFLPSKYASYPATGGMPGLQGHSDFESCGAIAAPGPENACRRLRTAK